VWNVPEGAVPATTRDFWLRAAGLTALFTCGIAALLFLLFRLILANGLASINSLASYLPTSVGF